MVWVSRVYGQFVWTHSLEEHVRQGVHFHSLEEHVRQRVHFSATGRADQHVVAIWEQEMMAGSLWLVYNVEVDRLELYMKEYILEGRLAKSIAELRSVTLSSSMFSSFTRV